LAFAWGLQRQRMSLGLCRLLALAPLYFAAKMVHWDFSWVLAGREGFAVNRYWEIVLQWPAKLAVLMGVFWIVWRVGWLGEGGNTGGTRGFGETQGFGQAPGFGEAIGLTVRNFNARPYFVLLMMLVPVVALASTQADFLRVYPKVSAVAFMKGVPGKVVYELAYGLDFVSIEVFFRGLLVIGVVRYAGEQAILPMAAFYCTIHFGKPLGECLTSFVGGMALGVLAYRTRSVLGGLIVHLGLAWMMEVGGWLGNLYA
jgi:Type II CAAX prenyl endopeptidase Rce1-like